MILLDNGKHVQMMVKQCKHDTSGGHLEEKEQM